MPEAVETKAFEMACPRCGSGQFSISEAGLAGRPKEWGPGVLGVADCRSCQQVFLVKLPWNLARVVMEMLRDVLPAETVIPVRRALGV